MGITFGLLAQVTESCIYLLEKRITKNPKWNGISSASEKIMFKTLEWFSTSLFFFVFFCVEHMTLRKDTLYKSFIVPFSRPTEVYFNKNSGKRGEIERDNENKKITILSSEKWETWYSFVDSVFQELKYFHLTSLNDQISGIQCCCFINLRNKSSVYFTY